MLVTCIYFFQPGISTGFQIFLY